MIMMWHTEIPTYGFRQQTAIFEVTAYLFFPEHRDYLVPLDLLARYYAKLDVQKRPEEPSRSRGEFEEV